MAPRKKTTGRKTSSARAKKTDLTVVKGGTAVAETSKKSTAVATVKADSEAEAKETAAKEETKASVAKETAAETKAETTAKVTATETKTADKPATRRGRPKKAEAQKTASRSRKAEVQKIEVHYFEIGEDQVSTEDVTARIMDSYKAEGHQIGRIKKIDVYYNFEERRAYYVINDNAEGKFVEF